MENDRTSSRALFVPLVPSFLPLVLALPPAVDLFDALDVDPPWEVAAWVNSNFFWSSRFSSLNFKSRLSGTHSSHLLQSKGDGGQLLVTEIEEMEGAERRVKSNKIWIKQAKKVLIAYAHSPVSPQLPRTRTLTFASNPYSAQDNVDQLPQ